MRPKCISSHPVDIDVFFTNRTISLPVIPYYRPELVLKRWVLHPAVRKLAFAHDDDDGCLDVEDMPKQVKNVSQPVGYPVEARKVFEMSNDH